MIHPNCCAASRDILSPQLQGQFVSVTYLWIDTERRTARYSAAGHPPLLCWCAACGKLARVESNGLLFGAPFDGDYPVCDIPFGRGDRFLLYTDGFSEPENAHGEAFGDQELEQIFSATIPRVPPPSFLCFCCPKSAPGSLPPRPSKTTSPSSSSMSCSRQ